MWVALRCQPLAFCNMRTLYLRNVPDDIVAKLEGLAKQAGMSVNAYAVRELAESARLADNAAVFDSLPDWDIPIGNVIEVLEAGRAERDRR